MRKCKGWIGLISLMILLNACQPNASTPQTSDNSSNNHQLIANLISTLHTGDIALRTGNDATSNILRQLNLRDKTFSHCGIVAVINGYPFVYHNIGGESNPNQSMRLDSAARFFNEKDNNLIGFLRMKLNDAEKKQLLDSVQSWYHAQLQFDMDFDIHTEDKMYCSEMVVKALNHAKSNEAFIQPYDTLCHEFYGVDFYKQVPQAVDTLAVIPFR